MLVVAQKTDNGQITQLASIDDEIYKSNPKELHEFGREDILYNIMMNLMKEDPTFSGIINYMAVQHKNVNWTKKEWSHQIWRRLWIASKLFHVILEEQKYSLTKWGKEFIESKKMEAFEKERKISASSDASALIPVSIPNEITSDDSMLEEVIPLMHTPPKEQEQDYQTIAIVDASNIVYSQQPWRLSTLVNIEKQLEKTYDRVDIICDANLRHQFKSGSEDREKYEDYLSKGHYKQSPAGREADYFILKFTESYIKRGKKPHIISNDLFRDYDDEFEWLKTRDYQKNFMLQDFGNDVELILT